MLIFTGWLSTSIVGCALWQAGLLRLLSARPKAGLVAKRKLGAYSATRASPDAQR